MSGRTWSFYDPATGLFTGALFSGPDDSIASNTPTGLVALEGRFDHLAERVDLDTGQVVDWTPPAPDVEHAWDAGARRWRPSAEAARRRYEMESALEAIAAAERKQLRALRELAIDPSNATALARLKEVDEEISALRPKSLEVGATA